MTDLTERLRKLLDDATPGDLSTAERHVENETVECPLCHEGEVEASDYCNIDGKALGVQFYGIGKEFGAHERLWSETLAALPGLLTTLETLTQEKEALRHKLWMVACHATGGGMRDIAGIDQSINDICVQISASRNLVWAEAQKHAAKDLAQENARLREALEGCEGIESGPNGRGGMRVVVHFPNGGDETALFHVLNAALAARKALGGCDE